MRLGIFLALVASAAALRCNTGNMIIQDGVITSKSLEPKLCYGTCQRTALNSAQGTIVVFGCEENEIANYVNNMEHKNGCSSTELGTECFCKDDDLCSDFVAEEQLVIRPEIVDDTQGPKCYVGYKANNSASGTPLNAGDTVMCGANMACASIDANVFGYDVMAFFCIPTGICSQLIPNKNAAGCGNVTQEQGTVEGCCCISPDCTYLASNKGVNVPPNVISDSQNVTCYSGAYLNYQPLNGGVRTLCQGSCSSFSVRTTYGAGVNKQQYMLDIYTCDPVELCTALNLKNDCGNLAISGSQSLIRGCCCDTDNCIDPTVAPPKYPVKQLKCWSGIYVPGTNYSLGAEQYCDGQCGRMEFVVNNQLIKYHMCAPYSACQGLGIAQADQCYNPPLDEETKICCCSTYDNCNIDKKDDIKSVNTTFVPTTSYPILCYGGIHVNGQPITTGSYSMCSGECAMASFTTTLWGAQHNTTIYTCDPVTMCKAGGISNGCGPIGNSGIQACCSDVEVAFDPNRKPFGNLTCYTGLYIAEDNYQVGGEMLCDGWCATLSTQVNNKSVTSFWCAPVPTCRRLALGMGGDYDCASIQGSSNTLTGCCCSTPNCNVAKYQLPNNITAIPPRVEPPIVCYNALWVNGKESAPGRYSVCDGECVSIFMGDRLSNGTVVSTTLYTCEPSGACSSMGLRNNCSNIDGTVTACCCDTDACIDPNNNRIPGTQLTCYVGVQTTWNNLSVGAEVNCDGRCANLTTTANGVPFTSYHCLSTGVCRGQGLDNSCKQVDLDRAILGCCCDNGANCNAGPGINTTLPIAQPSAPIACYSGVQVNGVFTAGSKWQACQGECMSVTLNTTWNGATFMASVYSCDPTSVCSGLNITNRCHDIEPGVVRGCCCADSACIDPTKFPPKQPHGRPLSCFVGVVSSFNNFTAGAETACSGSCSALTGNVAGANVSIFACVPNSLCNYLGDYDNCNKLNPVIGDSSIKGCCCNNVDNCNTQLFNIKTGPARPDHEYPVVCYSGLLINGKSVGGGSWGACNGDCVSVTINQTVNGQFYNADFYTCDPANVCHQLNVVNNCSTLESGVGACCCDTDACLDPTSYPPKKPGKPLKCFVGVQTQTAIYGSETYCNGKCAAVMGTIGTNGQNSNVTVYSCAPTRICKTLEVNDQVKRLPLDPDLYAVCCDNYDNCNVRDPKVNTTQPIPQRTEYPITCYQGIQVNGQWITQAGFQSCNGDCVMLDLVSTVNNSVVTATIYTCDPTAVCYQMGMQNNCTVLQNGLDGCCCSSNGCIDPTKTPMKKPGKPLQCYVGFRSSYNNINVGATVQCSGKCSSLSGIVANQTVTTYHCIDSSICRSLELDDACRGLYDDREITACCCDNADFCNVKDPSITIPTANPNVEYPITCWSGAYLNGKAITPVKWTACQGDCVSVTLNTTIGTTQHSATLYTCDPSTICTQLNVVNNCASPEPGVGACCCNYDGCLDPVKGRTPGNPLMCYVGINSTYVQTGAAVQCNGKCTSLSGMVGGTQVTTFQCSDAAICRSLELYDECQSLPGDAEITGCCCDNQNYCNAKMVDPNYPIPAVQNYTEPAIACFSGLVINGNNFITPKYIACRGECASIQLNTTIGNVQHTASLYTCDPSTVCTALNVSNTCAAIENQVKGCCCNTDGCIDPTKNRFPDRPLTCYVGVYAAVNNYSVGADVVCDGGKCASLSTIYNNNLVKSYHCVQPAVCSALALDNSCNSVQTDRQITGCCCDNGNNCNAAGDPVSKNFVVANNTGAPIACWSGVYLNGNALGKPTWAACQGECAAIQFNTTASGQTNSLTLYTCDPVTVCNNLGIQNKCANLDTVPGLTGCCCNFDACMDQTSIYPKPNPNQGGSATTNSFFAVFLVAVYMMLRW